MFLHWGQCCRRNLTGFANLGFANLAKPAQKLRGFRQNGETQELRYLSWEKSHHVQDDKSFPNLLLHSQLVDINSGHFSHAMALQYLQTLEQLATSLLTL